MIVHMTEEMSESSEAKAAVALAQATADLTGNAQWVYWEIYGCNWVTVPERKTAGANVNYELEVRPRDQQGSSLLA